MTRVLRSLLLLVLVALPAMSIAQQSDRRVDYTNVRTPYSPDNAKVPPLVAMVLGQVGENPESFVRDKDNSAVCPQPEGDNTAVLYMTIESALGQIPMDHVWGVLSTGKKPAIWVVFHNPDKASSEPAYVGYIGGVDSAAIAKSLEKEVVAGGFPLQVNPDLKEVSPSELANLIDILPGMTQVQTCSTSGP